MTIRLYDYWRSSAAYRVRIALNMKGLDYQAIDTSLIDGAHKQADYVTKNPQGFVPMLEVGDVRLTQSLAIIDWLDATYPDPRLIPTEPTARAREMANALIIAADIHPVNNLRILKYLKNPLGAEQPEIDQWIRHWIGEGFTALEAMADPGKPFLAGDAPGLSDVCLVPQMYNARRFETPLDAYPNLVRIVDSCERLPAFEAAHPDRVNTSKQ